MTEPTSDQGAGCAPALVALIVLLLFAGTLTAVGLATTSFVLLFAALPVSAIFTAVGGDFVIAWPVDALVWIVAAWWIARRSGEDNRVQFVKMTAVVLAAALAYGLAMGLLVEPTGTF